jgi:hypothetical protein
LSIATCLWLCSAFVRDLKNRFGWRTRFWSWFPLNRRPMICITKRLDEFLSHIQTEISNSESISPWKSVSCDLRTNWRIRTDTGELADAERNALRAYLDEKGFKTAMIDNNLVIAGELTWKEVFEPIERFYEGKADAYPF